MCPMGIGNFELRITIMNIFFEDHPIILEKLIKNNVLFLLVGGYAVIVHGYNRTTGDMDLC